MGQELTHALQWRHSLSKTFFSTGDTYNILILLNGAKIAPIGQKYLHQPLSIIKIKMRNKIKMIKALLKNEHPCDYAVFLKKISREITMEDYIKCIEF